MPTRKYKGEDKVKVKDVTRFSVSSSLDNFVFQMTSFFRRPRLLHLIRHMINIDDVPLLYSLVEAAAYVSVKIAKMC